MNGPDAAAQAVTTQATRGAGTDGNGTPGGFDATYFGQLADVEAASFWFQARNALILWALRRYAPGMRSMIEVGCGTGFVLEAIATRFPDVALTGTELFAEGLELARDRVPSATLVQMDALDSPFDAAFDVAGAFDVLEHIEDDAGALRGIHRALRPGGLVMITVPQHRSLWSAQDDIAFHVRRYAAGELRTKLDDAGFDVVRSTSFVTLLLPLLVVSRLRRASKEDPTRDLRQPGFVRWGLAAVMTAERLLIRAGVPMPVGGSRLVVARRR
jgi:SAM-dependent methyltransferase